MSDFFIRRPIFAWVVALLISLLGVIALMTLPIGQYPSIAPPPVTVSVTYPGASAETVLKTVVQPIEEQMYGLDGLEYISSSAQQDGTAQVVLTFIQGTDPNIAQVQVQNRMTVAQALLPPDVVAQGVKITKATKSFTLIAMLVSEDNRLDSYALGDFVANHLQEPVTRVTGIGDYTFFGSEYAMRIWVKPEKLTSYGMTVTDVRNAVTNQNFQVSSGEIGALPSPDEQVLDAVILGPQRLTTPEDFQNILLKVNPDGTQVRLRDVARVELGAQSFQPKGLVDGHPAAGLALNLAPGANQIQTVSTVKALFDRAASSFPAGVHVVYAYDTAPFVMESMHEVVETLVIAIGLVVVVMYVFLQNFRATLIPTIAVPVVLLGTFAVIQASGFMLNTLTMLALVLAIGLLVDDAIVVVENVERLMAEENLSPADATSRSMKEITGALFGITMVLSVVFLPMAFFGGSAGIIYRQFSITIIAAMTLSVITAITFTPALCATILRPSHGQATKGPFGWFNRSFDALLEYYGRIVVRLNATPLAWGGYLFLSVAAVLCFFKLSEGFLPDEDQEVVFVQVQSPLNSSAHVTERVQKDIREYVQAHDKGAVENVLTVFGFHFGGRSQSAGFIAVKLKHIDERTGAVRTAQDIASDINGHFATYGVAQVVAFLPPPVIELGNASGFDFELTNPGGIPYEQFSQAKDQLIAMARKDPRLVAVRLNGLDDAPQWHLNVLRERANAYSVSNSDINDTIGSAFGSAYINQFNMSGRAKKVFLQGEMDSRLQPRDLEKWFVRNTQGQMVPLTAFTDPKWEIGAQKQDVYNGVPAFEILGAPAAGISSSEAMKIMEDYAAKLPVGLSHEWSSISYEQQQSAGQSGKLYAVSLIVVILCLAGLYESWSIPVAVMLVIPLGILGAALATFLRGLANDIYFQVGLLTTVGLATKNAILIVEFAKMHYDAGATLADAALIAAKERLRPILMTSFAFIVGTLPLALATGAGSAAHIAIGTAVVGGMTGATVLAVLFVPKFFVSVLTLFRVQRNAPDKPPVSTAEEGGAH
ncbi:MULTISPECIES: efflux RND transporter permease subunit [Acetobacteraceae]|uniref:Efflux pump membrane transporter n=10 Tax=Acetobacteraceae TaxID=433 RepID=A0A967EI88_9PROT|nr:MULTISPECIES: efflux RND transporter permease subunit [Acetobacteraceae]ASL40324.1 multidrug efflux RND transporter permease subunit [Acetobacter oryzifermentans]ATI13293.1 multidrug efflux RND transporter permease subunit [Acetobacter pomorum]KAA8384660.1 multidrug efflux RND transporter permease subunit [Acetobacter tropicalis]KAA8388542.1 multidrug efflux RND transporter permease subunit [Acetobacter tropicalis]KAA8388568.1 multidrug efflux RND transporter permease subunit [Acetobacter s